MKLDFKLVDILMSQTGVKFKDCADAIEQTNNDIDKAIELLKNQGKMSTDEADEIIEERNDHSTATVRCPKCGSSQIQAMKRGWKLTTGFIGSSKIERVCLNCKNKF